MISSVVEGITEVEEEQTTENLDLVIDVITDTIVVDGTITAEVSGLVYFVYMQNNLHINLNF